MENNETLASVIKNSRINKGLSQKQLAELINVDSSYITKMENGKKRNPSFLVIFKLSAVLQIELIDLIELSGLDIKDFINLNALEEIEVMGVDPKLIQKYTKNGTLDINAAISDYKNNEITETDVIELFVHALGYHSNTSKFTTDYILKNIKELQ